LGKALTDPAVGLGLIASGGAVTLLDALITTVRMPVLILDLGWHWRFSDFLGCIIRSQPISCS
jgi:hypothetical protein